MNVNQNHNEIILKMARVKKSDNKCEDIEKLESSYVSGWNVKWYNHFGKHPGSSSES